MHDSDMQEKKNIRLLISLVVLIMLSALTYWVMQKKAGVIEVDKGMFKVEDATTIDRVTLESKQDTIELHYNGTRWKVNDIHDADRTMIDILFATLLKVEPKRPVSEKIRDSIAQTIRENGVHVSLYSGKNMERKFIAGGDNNKVQAYFMLSASSNPFSAIIPGYRVYASGIFELEESEWRDKFVFGFNWRNFEGLDMDFPQNPSNNFTIAKDENYFGIHGISTVDTARLNDFLDEVSLLQVDQYLKKDLPVYDSLSNTVPQIKITVDHVGDKVFTLALYPALNSQNMTFGLINGTQPALFDRRKVLNLARPRSYFIKK